MHSRVLQECKVRNERKGVLFSILERKNNQEYIVGVLGEFGEERTMCS